MKQAFESYRVLVPTRMFGTVRVAKGDVVRRELLGAGLRRLISEGVVEPIAPKSSPRPTQATGF